MPQALPEEPWLSSERSLLLSSRSPRPSLVPTGNLGEPVLLPLRVPVPRFHHPGSVLFTNQHRHGVLPAVCRGEGSRPVGGVEWDCRGWISHVSTSDYLDSLPKPFSSTLELMVPTSLHGCDLSTPIHSRGQLSSWQVQTPAQGLSPLWAEG